MIVSFFLLFPAPRAAAQNTATLTGTVVDAQENSSLPGANVALRTPDDTSPMRGTSTGADGTFRLTGVEPGAYVVEVRFVGYRAREIDVTLEAGETRDLNVELRPETQSLETVVVSASRRQEKILDAPASISVLEPEEIQREVNTSSVEAIRSTPGVDMAQTGLDRREVSLRGFNDAFSSATYVLTDYRQAAVPSLGVNVYSIMPNMSIDVERIEVVRGPGSALYGPGVDSGVIHFFTKGPFQDPGTSISVAGGSRAFFSGQFRHAGTVTERLGYKVTAQYAQGNEWELSPSVVDPAEIDEIQSDPTRSLDPESREVSRYRVYQSRDAVPDGRPVYEIDQDGDGEPDLFRLRRQNDYQKFNANGLLQYRADWATISANGGYGQITSPVQSGIGTLQPDGFGYAYGQLRVEAGNLFTQVYVNRNFDGGDTYVYGSGDTIVDESLQWNAQAQYDFQLSPIGTQFIVGADADLTTPRTGGEILGRNEGDDHINEYGGYAQSTTELTSRLSLTLAGRVDYNNIIEEARLSPRAALVFKPASNHTLRGSFNQAISSPGTNSNFLDIEAQRQPLGNNRNLVFQGLGAADGFTFDNFRNGGNVRFSLPVPGFFKEQYSVNALPVAPMYAAVASGAIDSEGGISFTQEVAAQLPDGLSDQQRSLLARFFGLTAREASRILDPGTSDNPQNRTDGVQLGIPDDSEKGFREVSGPTDISPLEQTTTQTFEVGYKGIFADRILVNVDGYYERKEDFISPLQIESPLAYLQEGELSQDVKTALEQADLSNFPFFANILDDLEDTGISRESAATLLGGIVGNGLNQTPTAVVQPDQEVIPNQAAKDTTVGGFLSYRNFGTVEYWGIDASVEVQVTDQLDTFGNVSIVSDDFFDNEELDEANQDLSVALNAPSFKAKGGFDYRLDDVGVTFGATGHYVEGFPVRSGPYVGDVEAYFLLDLRAGYDVPSLSGLRFDVTAKNVLDNEHREFVGAPKLGLMVMGRLTYTLP